jgi:hypothetical protein
MAFDLGLLLELARLDKVDQLIEKDARFFCSNIMSDDMQCVYQASTDLVGIPAAPHRRHALCL